MGNIQNLEYIKNKIGDIPHKSREKLLKKLCYSQKSWFQLRIHKEEKK